jgi:hypothetical protein
MEIQIFHHAKNIYNLQKNGGLSQEIGFGSA